jgi:hypothetical protein
MPSVETDPMVSVFERAVRMLDTVLGEIAERGDTEQYLRTLGYLQTWHLFGKGVQGVMNEILEAESSQSLDQPVHALPEPKPLPEVVIPEEDGHVAAHLGHDDVPDSDVPESLGPDIETGKILPSEETAEQEENAQENFPGLTPRAQLVYARLIQANGEKLSPASLRSVILEANPNMTQMAARQALTTAIKAIIAHPQFGSGLKASGATMNRLYWLEIDKNPDLLPTEESSSAVNNFEDVIKSNVQPEPADVTEPAAEVPDKSPKEEFPLYGLDMLDPEINIHQLPVGFMPLTRNGLGFVAVDGNGTKEYYIRGKRVQLSPLATQIVRLLVTGESEQKLSSDLLSLLPVARDLSALHKEVEHLARILFDEGRGFYAVKRPIDGSFSATLVFVSQ